MNRCIFLFVAIVVQAQEHTPERDKNPFAGNTDAAIAGRRVYEQTCQSCHGGGGRGDRAPALTSGRFARGGADGEIFLNIRNGISGTQMPGFKALNIEQVWQLVTYIRSISGGNVPTGERVAGDLRNGETLFFGKAGCANCHEVNGRGGLIGPDLSAAGRLPADLIRTKILDPSAPPAGGAPRGRRAMGRGVVSVKTKDGRELRGLRTADDTFTLHLITLDGKRHLFAKDALAEIRPESGSLMPGDYSARLTATELAT